MRHFTKDFEIHDWIELVSWSILALLLLAGIVVSFVVAPVPMITLLIMFTGTFLAVGLFSRLYLPGAALLVLATTMAVSIWLFSKVLH